MTLLRPGQNRAAELQELIRSGSPARRRRMARLRARPIHRWEMAGMVLVVAAILAASTDSLGGALIVGGLGLLVALVAAGAAGRKAPLRALAAPSRRCYSCGAQTYRSRAGVVVCTSCGLNELLCKRCPALGFVPTTPPSRTRSPLVKIGGWRIH